MQIYLSLMLKWIRWLCFGDGGKIVISDISGGIAPYQYSFDGGKTFSSSPIMTGLGSGQYQIIVRDAVDVTMSISYYRFDRTSIC